MQGTGTQADPYIPATWSEFVTAVGKSGVYVSLPEGGGVFDMNEIAPEGGIKVTFSCIKIDGNGWIIHAPHNIAFEAYNSDQSHIINDLNFLDFEFTGAPKKMMFDGGNRWMYMRFNGCTFTGKISGGSDVYLFDEVLSMDQCSITVAFTGNTYKLFNDNASNNLTMTNVKTKLDYSGCTYTTTEKITTPSDKKINDSLFEITNCGLDFEYSGLRSVFHVNGNGGYVRNADGVKNNVTEEQLRSTAYLNSIGYPIEVKA